MADPTLEDRDAAVANPATRSSRPHQAADSRDVLSAADAVASLSAQSLAAVAEANGMTPLQLRRSLDAKLVELALGGDLDALLHLQERTAGVVLGPIERVRSAGRLARRVEKALGQGLISIGEAQKLTQLVRVRRELERDNLEERLRAVEGRVLERVE
jgi:hypothetical protein